MDLNFDYITLGYSQITDIQDFYKTKLPEIPNIRSLIGGCSRLFKIPQRNISLAISRNEGKDKIYRLGLENSGKEVIGIIYYIPSERRLDIYDTDPRIPLVVWKNKRCVWKNYSELLGKLGLEKLFQPLISGL